MKLINRRGQFSIMAAFMVLAVVTSAMFVSFNRIQENQFTKPITLASDIKDVNTALHELLGFTAGYYGSIIKLTGNVTYAREKTNSYFESGLETIAHADVREHCFPHLKRCRGEDELVWAGRLHSGIPIRRLLDTLDRVVRDEV